MKKNNKIIITILLFVLGCNNVMKTAEAHQAAETCDVKSLAQLLHNGASPNETDRSGNTTLHKAIQGRGFHCSTAAVQLLLHTGADPNAQNAFAPVHFAAGHPRKIGALKALLLAKADPNQIANNGLTPLHIAAQSSEKGVKELLNAKADVNIPNSHNQTVLHYSVGKGRVDITQILVDAKAHPHFADNNGETPFDYATQDGREDILDLFKN